MKTMRIVKQWKRAKSEREKLRANAERATVYIVRDARGHIIAAR